MSPLPGWRLVWSLYGRFWCRSSLEGLWRTGARACGQGPCGAVSPARDCRAPDGLGRRRSLSPSRASELAGECPDSAERPKSHSVGLFLRSEAVEPPDLQREHRDQQSVGHRGSAPLRSAAVRPENGRDLWISPPKHAPQRNLPGSTRPRHGPLTTERTTPWTCERTRQLTRLARDG